MLTVPTKLANELAPGMATDMTLDFTDSNLSGNVSFKLPSMTYGGKVALNGKVNYTLIANSDTLAKGTGDAGATVNTSVTVNQGFNSFIVIASNNQGDGPRARLTKWIGYDIPNKPKNVTLSIDNDEKKASLTWDENPTVKNSGYLGELTYNVYRILDNDTVEVAKDLTTTSYEETINSDQMATYAYGVEAVNGNQKSDLATSNNAVYGLVYTVPFFEDFNSADILDNWTTIDQNNDGTTWRWSSYYGTNISAGSNGNDDWLITPSIELKKGYQYVLSYKAAPGLSYFSEEMEVKMGHGNTVDNMTTSLLPTTTITKNNTHFSHNIEVSEDGNYNIGFHCTSPSSGFNLSIDSVSLVRGASNNAPDTVSQIKITPDASGALKANLSFVTPTKTIKGGALASLTKITVSRDGNVIKTFDNPELGATLSFTDDAITKNGINTYTFVASNDEGDGLKKTASAYVGVDVPSVPTNVKVADNTTSVSISWSPVGTTGANGGVVIPADVKYVILNSYSGFLGSAIDTVESTSYTVNVNTQEGSSQSVKQWAVSALNGAGQGDAATVTAIMGKSLTLPYKDSFAGEKTSTYWWNERSSRSGFEFVDDAADADGGSAKFTTSKAGDEASLNTGKITLAGSVKPEVIFNYKADDNAANLYVDVAKPNGTVTTVGTYTGSTGSAWKTAKIDLSQFINEPYVIVKFRAHGDNVDDAVLIDNVIIDDVPDMNLSVGVDAVDSITKGQTIHATATVSNKGNDAASGYNLKIYANDKLVSDSVVAAELKSFETTTFSYDILTASASDEEAMNIKAEVTLAGDEKASDNVAEKSVKLIKTDKPAVPLVSATGGNEAPVTVSWSKPEETQKAVTEDFESYSPFATSFGDWKTVDGTHGLNGSFFSFYMYEHQGEEASFLIFHPELFHSEWSTDYKGIMKSYPFLASHSGAQYAAAPFDYKGDSQLPADNWLITPQLSGKAQTITFYVHNAVQKDYSGNSTSYPENYDLLYSTTTNDTIAFTKIGNTRTISSGNWEEVSVDVPDGAQYFAIHQHTPVEKTMLFSVDDFTYSVGSGLPVSYNIYRDGELVATVSADKELTLTDTPANGEHVYAVTAVYSDGSESAPATASISVTTGIEQITVSDVKTFDVFTVDGKLVKRGAKNFDGLTQGVYVVNNKKVIVK